jgi:hypothetical protein
VGAEDMSAARATDAGSSAGRLEGSQGRAPTAGVLGGGLCVQVDAKPQVHPNMLDVKTQESYPS